jgi:anti-sigma regulatory factor (Ser/Thr protein kinase)
VRVGGTYPNPRKASREVLSHWICGYEPSPMRELGYRHAATFYEDAHEFVGQLAPFVRAGVARDEPTLVVLPAAKIDALRAELNGEAAKVRFEDVTAIGANPAWIIPAWEEFLEAHSGRRTRGIGEPIFPGRSADELTECQHHERLLNGALAESQLYLLCPYDTQSMPAEVIAEARHSHPLLYSAGRNRRSAGYDPAEAARGMLDEPLPEPEAEPETMVFDLDTLPRVRRFVRATAEASGLDEERAHQLLTAVGELAANSVRHGGGRGDLRTWRTDDRLFYEVRDRGHIDDPLVDRRRPRADRVGGWGRWMANHSCDHVQLRSLPGGVVARLHMRLT